MLKCPRGTPSQIKANIAYINRRNILSNDALQEDPEEKSDTFSGECSETSELSSIRTDKNYPASARDELVYFFLNSFLDSLLESWEEKPRVKQKLPPERQNMEVYGEDLGPCELSTTSSMSDYLKDLYQKRSSGTLREKVMKESETTESEYIIEEDFESPLPSESKKPLTDEDVHFTFMNGAWYKGRVSGRLMDGEGFYFWEDGTAFEGEFEEGCATGKGRLEFPDLSTYEGDVYKGFRHGQGMFCFSGSPVMYSGEWWLGKKHGEGLILYKDPSEGHDFYTGQWQNGVKEGFGFRQYPSGAMYIGFWSNGKRHGKGVMFWTNNDIYRGYWKEGLMHGFGEYTWKGFINRTLSYPVSNIYRGNWENGKRNGRGLLELKNGVVIETNWVDNFKDGPGVIICKNGGVITSEKLFEKDKQVATEDKRKQKIEERGIKHSLPDEQARIHAPIQYLNLSFHLEKLEIQLKKKKPEESFQLNLIPVTPKNVTDVKKNAFGNAGSEKSKVSNEQTKVSIQRERRLYKEEKMLRNFITTKTLVLRNCYDDYAKMACQDTPSYKCILLRMFLWQMLVDGGIPNSRLSLVDIDDIIAHQEYILLQEPHDPFERIQFWQFLHILIFLSWHLYGQYAMGVRPLVEEQNLQDFLQIYVNHDCKNIMKIALEYFIEKHLFLESSKQIKRFEEADLAPLEAMYLIYRDVGEPHSARDFLNAVCCRESDAAGTSPDIVRYFEKLPFYKVEGKNVLIVAGELQHLTEDKPFNSPEIFQLERHHRKLQPKSELTCFNDLTAKNVIECLVEVCPGIMEEDCIVNMEYKLTFIEFYKVIILCTKMKLKMKVLEDMKESIIAEYKIQMEEYEKQMNDFEKLKETLATSRRKSRQLPDPAKKGKK